MEVSARVDFKENKFKLSPELEYTLAATWGAMDSSAKVVSAKENVGNFRALVKLLIHSK